MSVQNLATSLLSPEQKVPPPSTFLFLGLMARSSNGEYYMSCVVSSSSWWTSYDLSYFGSGLWWKNSSFDCEWSTQKCRCSIQCKSVDYSTCLGLETRKRTTYPPCRKIQYPPRWCLTHSVPLLPFYLRINVLVCNFLRNSLLQSKLNKSLNKKPKERPSSSTEPVKKNKVLFSFLGCSWQ